MNRRKFLQAAVTSASYVSCAATKTEEPRRVSSKQSTASEPRVVDIYLVSAQLKCTAEQAKIVEAVLNGLGKEFGEDTYVLDWQISKRLYGAWEE
jgi:hypothetical protein